MLNVTVNLTANLIVNVIVNQYSCSNTNLIVNRKIDVEYTLYVLVKLINLFKIKTF